MATAKTGSTQVDLLQSATRLSDKVQGALTKWSASLQAKATQPIAAAPVNVAESLPAQSSPKEMDASQSNAEATTKTEDDKPATRLQKIIGCGGCLGFIVLFLVTCSVLVSGPSITITGDSGAMHYKVNSLYTAQLAGNTVAQKVYLAAKKHPELKSISLELELDVAGGAIDKYGNTADGPFIMGTITVSDLDDVRKYADEFSYASKNDRRFGYQILEMKYSNLLGK